MLIAVGLSVGCDDGDPADAGMDAGADAGRIDSGVPDAGAPFPDDAGDAGTDGGAPQPGQLIASGVCATNGAVDVSPDGARVAYATCSGDVAIFASRLATIAPTRLADGAADATVRFSPDGAWVLYGPANAMAVRDPAAGAAEATIGAVRAARFVDAPGGLVLLTLEDAGAGRRLASYSAAGGFATARVLHDDATLETDLSLVSGSRRTLMYTVEEGGARVYRTVDTAAAAAAALLPIDPGTTVFGPVGMGDTHGIAASGGGLSFLEFATGVGAELAPDGVVATDPRYDVTIGADRYVYFLRNGDVTRRLRNGATAAETLATSDATDLRITPDLGRLVYLANMEMRSIAIDGTGEAVIAPYPGAATLDGELSPDSAELAHVLGGFLHVATVDGSSAARPVEGPGVVAGSAHYDGAGRLVWRIQMDEMSRPNALRAGTPPATIAWDVDAYWVIPGSSALLYRTTSGELRLLE